MNNIECETRELQFNKDFQRAVERLKAMVNMLEQIFNDENIDMVKIIESDVFALTLFYTNTIGESFFRSKNMINKDYHPCAWVMSILYDECESLKKAYGCVSNEDGQWLDEQIDELSKTYEKLKGA